MLPWWYANRMNNRTHIYLDYNASAPLRPEARTAMARVWAGGPGNASSVHAFGRKARLSVEEARRTIAAHTGAAPEEVVFTSGGTEGNATALNVLPGQPVRIAATVHDSIRRNAPPGASFLSVHPSGLLDLESLDRELAGTPSPFLVSLEWVNHETGVIQPVAEVQALVRRRGGVLHVDGVQALGKIRLAVQPDLLTLSAHKIGGPQGVGALIVREGTPFLPLLRGGGQEKGRRAGSENVAGIAGFAAALAVCHVPDPTWQHLFEEKLRHLEGVRILGADAPRVASTTCFVRAGMRAETVLMALDLSGFAVSAGSACASGRVGTSAVLEGMGVPEAERRSALRVSWGWDSTLPDLLSFVPALAQCEAPGGALGGASGHPHPITPVGRPEP